MYKQAIKKRIETVKKRSSDNSADFDEVMTEVWEIIEQQRLENESLRETIDIDAVPFHLINHDNKCLAAHVAKLAKLLAESVRTHEMWADVAPAISLVHDMRALLDETPAQTLAHIELAERHRAARICMNKAARWGTGADELYNTACKECAEEIMED